GACGGASAADAYALVTFPSLARYGYSAVAGDGGWDLLLQRSMVHFRGSAAPGGTGNDIIAFHREPGFEHVDLLAVGDTVEVQDRGCRLWRYTVRRRSVLAPERVDQLAATPDAELTLITCDPWFRDDNRIVWQAAPRSRRRPSRPSRPGSSTPFPWARGWRRSRAGPGPGPPRRRWSALPRRCPGRPG